MIPFVKAEYRERFYASAVSFFSAIAMTFIVVFENLGNKVVWVSTLNPS
jgi:hypothetical protein